MSNESEALLRVRRWRAEVAKELEGKSWEEIFAYLEAHRDEKVVKPEHLPTLDDLRDSPDQLAS